MLIVPQFWNTVYPVDYMVDLLALLDTTKPCCYLLFTYWMYFWNLSDPLISEMIGISNRSTQVNEVHEIDYLWTKYGDFIGLSFQGVMRTFCVSEKKWKYISILSWQNQTDFYFLAILFPGHILEKLNNNSTKRLENS